MLLLINTLIAPSAGSILKYDRGFLPRHSNYEIFLYTLYSYSTIPFNKVLLHLELDPIYEDKKEELSNICNVLFKNCDIVWSRLIYQEDWKSTISQIDENHIWLLCNHDHPFMDSSLTALRNSFDELRKCDEPATITFSHWSECLYQATLNKARELKHSYEFTVHGGDPIPSIQLMNFELLRSIFYDYNYGSAELPRLDIAPGNRGISVKHPSYTMLVPFKELCRHFDGYFHHNAYLLNEEVPALSIPVGFPGKLEIKIGYDEPFLGCINLNPTKEYLAVDPTGTFDYYLEDDIPLFWKSRNCSLDINPEADIISLQTARKKKIETIASAACRRFGLEFDPERVLKTYD